MKNVIICFFFPILVFIALASLNLISLWVDSGSNRRIILLSLSLYGHFIYIQQLYWALPHNGDTIPDIGKSEKNFERDEEKKKNK